VVSIGVNPLVSVVSGHPSFRPCGVYQYVDNPRIFDYLSVNYICYFTVVKIYYWLYAVDLRACQSFPNHFLKCAKACLI